MWPHRAIERNTPIKGIYKNLCLCQNLGVFHHWTKTLSDRARPRFSDRLALYQQFRVYKYSLHQHLDNQHRSEDLPQSLLGKTGTTKGTLVEEKKKNLKKISSPNKKISLKG